MNSIDNIWVSCAIINLLQHLLIGNRLTWTDIDMGEGMGFTSASGGKISANLGIQSVVVRVWFTPSIEKGLVEQVSKLTLTIYNQLKC